MIFSFSYSFKRNNLIPQDLQQTAAWSYFAKSTYYGIVSSFMMFIWIIDKILKGIFANGNFVYKDDKETDNLEIKNSLSCSFIKLKIQMFCN